MATVFVGRYVTEAEVDSLRDDIPDATVLLFWSVFLGTSSEAVKAQIFDDFRLMLAEDLEEGATIGVITATPNATIGCFDMAVDISYPNGTVHTETAVFRIEERTLE